LFVQLTGLGQVLVLDKLLQSPFSLHTTLLEYIDNEINEAKAGRDARIMARMNSLAEPQIIKALYRASQAGVQIDLIVRGICSLRPGVPNVSENIRVRSILGRFLEHSRAYYFYAGGKERTYLASADWLPRNLFRRAEICFPIEKKEMRDRVIYEAFQIYIDDNSAGWDLQEDGTYKKVVRKDSEDVFNAQDTLVQLLANKGAQTLPTKFAKPRKY
ncbi:MAG: RNA degradosome polyphosphate kinase, partial [Planctomycetota bacterium]|nr:RNA degradosome polyphosphate kinase [Planctomycetota bacterium]